MLAKLTCRGRDFGRGRAGQRALAEFRIRGVSTNIPFLQACSTTRFVAGDLSTLFIDERPELLTGPLEGPRDPSAELARRCHRQPAHGTSRCRRRRAQAPAIDLSAAPPRAPASGCSSSARRVRPALREQTALAVTETTFRDAHQSLLATRVRTRDLVRSRRTSRA
jgi:pyruvate carboxylase